MPYINLLCRPDRLGANITTFIAQIIYAHKNKLEIRYNRDFINTTHFGYCQFNKRYLNTFFIDVILDYIDYYNSTITKDDVIVEIFTLDYFKMISQVVLVVEMDLVSYFKKFIYDDIINIFKLKSIQKKYTIPFDVENTIVVHLRLEDARLVNDYDGRLCSSVFSSLLDNNQVINYDYGDMITSKYGPNQNRQSPIPFIRIQECIDKIKKETPNDNVVIITSPNEDISNIPYPVLSSYDESYDLFLLCNSKKLILSRSTFAISSVFFSDGDIYYLPLWGHQSCFGLSTKFDKTKNIMYFF